MIHYLSSNKAPGFDYSPKIYSDGGEGMIANLHVIFCQMWESETIPQDLNDVLIIYFYKVNLILK